MNRPVRTDTYRMAVLALAASGAVSAHHSYAMFDKTQTLSLAGTLYAVEWKNPHSWIWVDAVAANGTHAVWGFEAGAPPALLHQGYSKKNLLVGTRVEVRYNPLKDGRTGGNLVDLSIDGGAAP